MPSSLVTPRPAFRFPTSRIQSRSLSATATGQTGNQKYPQSLVYKSVLALQY